jgi:hypothetical protein
MEQAIKEERPARDAGKLPSPSLALKRSARIAVEQQSSTDASHPDRRAIHCWSHLRRRYVKLVRNTISPFAEAAVRQIAALYAVEATVRGAPPQIRLDARTEHSAPIITALKPWFEKQLSMVSSGSTLATDIRYALSHWDGLTRFLQDGRLELDTNPVENAIRPVALTRKNALFAGHEVGAENWALLASIVATCKLNDANPVAYIAETVQAILRAVSRSLCHGTSGKRQFPTHRGSARRLLSRML